jgi:hypothetical protein
VNFSSCKSLYTYGVWKDKHTQTVCILSLFYSYVQVATERKLYISKNIKNFRKKSNRAFLCNLGIPGFPETVHFPVPGNFLKCRKYLNITQIKA